MRLAPGAPGFAVAAARRGPVALCVGGTGHDTAGSLVSPM